MEANIRKKAEMKYSSRDSFDDFDSGLSATDGLRPRRNSVTGMRQIRTISSMDDELLEMMKPSKSGSKQTRPGMGSPLTSRDRRYSITGGQSMAGSAEDKDWAGPGSGGGLRGRLSSFSRSPMPLSYMLSGGAASASPGSSYSAALTDLPKAPKQRTTKNKRRNSTGTLYIDR